MPQAGVLLIYCYDVVSVVNLYKKNRDAQMNASIPLKNDFNEI